MAVKKRFMALALAGVALALTVTGVVIAATDSNPAGLAKDPLVLNGYPPSTAMLDVHLSSGSAFSLSATVAANFTADKVDGIVTIPTVVSGAAIELRMIADQLYARSAAQSSGPWMTAKVKTPSLFGVALELTKPDIKLITGFQETKTKSGYSTTYTLYRDHVALTSLFGSSSTSVLGSVLWTITVGSQGEVSASSVTVRSAHTVTTLSVTVTSYNKAVHVATPTDVKTIALGSIDKIFTSKSLPTLLIPRNLTSLSTATLS
ncbi:MAG TPA: hypothetical protein VGZ68_10140 [Acidimicrobiales bacterium]|jgi:hypothetical protein|nr:hypothetical protein [Acidimicrobiales bacterium]